MWNFTLTYIRAACPWSDIKKWGSRAVGTYLAMPSGGLGWAADVSLAVVAHRLRYAARVLRFQIIWRRRVGFELSVAGNVYPVAALVRERFQVPLLIHPGDRSPNGTDGHTQQACALGLGSQKGCQQPLQSCEPVPVPVCRPPALLAPLPNLGLAVGLRSSDPPMRAILATVIGLSPHAPKKQLDVTGQAQLARVLVAVVPWVRRQLRQILEGGLAGNPVGWDRSYPTAPFPKLSSPG
jgi:hypothetical protein